MEKLRELTIKALPPLLFFALVLCIWHGAVVIFEIKPFMLPGPLQVASAVGTNLPRLLSATALTANLNNRISLSTTFTLRYENKPVAEKQLDTITSVLLGVRFI